MGCLGSRQRCLDRYALASLLLTLSDPLIFGIISASPVKVRYLRTIYNFCDTNRMNCSITITTSGALRLTHTMSTRESSFLICRENKHLRIRLPSAMYSKTGPPSPTLRTTLLGPTSNLTTIFDSTSIATVSQVGVYLSTTA